MYVTWCELVVLLSTYYLFKHFNCSNHIVL